MSNQIFAKALQPSDGSKSFDLAVFDLAFDEEPLRRRRRNLRHRLIDQSEQLLVFADMMSSIPDRPRMFHTGSNKGK
eukprot:11165079-Lingulodinium_polyedra.AAC.1